MAVLLPAFFSCQQENRVRQNDHRACRVIAEPHMRIQHGGGMKDSLEIDSLIQQAEKLRQQQADSAMRLFQHAYFYSQKIDYKPGQIKAAWGLGDCYSGQDPDYQKARSLYLRAVPIVLDYNDNSAWLPATYLKIGKTYYYEGNYDSANYYYYETLPALLNNKSRDTALLISTYANIGATLEKVDWNYSRSMQYSQAARELASLKNDTLQLAFILKNIGVLFARMENFDSALISYFRALALEQKNHNQANVQDLYVYIMNALLNQDEIQRAKTYLDSAIAVNPIRASNNISLLQQQGYIYSIEGYYSKAVDYYKMALQQSDLQGERFHKLASYVELSVLYSTTGHWQQAYQYQKAYALLKDSLLNEDKIKAINQLEIKYRTSEKDRQLARKDLEILKAEAKSQRTAGILWISSLCIILLVGSVFFLRYRQKNKLQQLDQQKALDLLKAGMEGEEKERVRVGQELHDGISGLLSAIKMNLATLRLNRADIAGERNFITTMELADEAADELRKTAHNLVSSNLGSKGLFKAIQGFCERVGSAELDLQVTGTGTPRRLDSAKELIIYRNIQELVHNMIRHSQASKGEISLSWQNTLLLITVEDNGKGISSDEENTGIGFENIRSSIQKLAGTLEIESHSGAGTSIYLEYPI